MGPSSLQQDSNYFLALNNIHVKHLKSSPYHPATNGLVECFIQTLKQALRVLKRDGHTAAQPGQLLIELPKRKTTYHRSHTGNIDYLQCRLSLLKPDLRKNQCFKMSLDRSCQGLQLLNAFVMLETELWLEITGLVILGGKQPQLSSKSCKVEIDGAEVWKRQADQMTATGVGNGIEDEPVSMAVEPEWRLDRQGDSAA